MTQEIPMLETPLSETKLVKTNTRKITMTESIQQKAAMILSKYHPKLLLDGKNKPDELLSLIIGEAIEYYYDNKLKPEIFQTNEENPNISNDK